MAFYNEQRMPWGSKPIYIVCRACGHVNYCPFKMTYEGIPVYSHQCKKCGNWTKFLKPEQAERLYKNRWKKTLKDIKKREPQQKDKVIEQKAIKDQYSRDRLNKLSFEVQELSKKIESRDAYIQGVIDKYLQDFSFKLSARVELMAKQEIRSQLSNEGFRDYIRSIGKDVFSNHKDIIKVVVEEVLKKLNTMLRQELKVTKEITYSIEKEIKKTYFDSNLSYDCTKKIYDRIKDKLQLPERVKIEIDGEPKKLAKNNTFPK